MVEDTRKKTNTNMGGTLYIQSVDGGTEKIGGFTNLTFSSTALLKEFPKVKKVEFHNKMVTVVYFDDGDIIRCKVGKGDTFNKEYGYSMCLAKKYMGSYEHFKWSLDKAKEYTNGVKVKKSKTPLRAGITIEEFGEGLRKLQREVNERVK